MPNTLSTIDFSTADLAKIERSTREVGHWLFDHLDSRRSTFLQRDWWDQRLMDWVMRDESIKLQMFRFIDVLPMLGKNAAAAQHLQEYLGPLHARLPLPMRMALDAARLVRPAERILVAAARHGAAVNARRFIAGSNAQEVLAAAFAQRQAKRAFTLDVLGEAVTSEAEAEHYLQAYLDLIANIAPTVNGWPEIARLDRDDRGPIPRVNVSVKLSALDSQFDPIDPDGTAHPGRGPACELCYASRESMGAQVHVDMESYQAKDLTLEIYRHILSEEEFRDWPHVGIVIQCYLKDSERDLAQLAAWAEERGTPIWVRLVKGAYWDYETVQAASRGWPVPVFENKSQTDACFERLTRQSLRSYKFLRPALGSHNLRSLAHGIAVARFLDLPDNAYEIQMLYGMADAEKQAIVEMGQRMRIYMPYGELIPGMAYLVRRLLENTSNDSFVRASFADHVAPEKLLMNPLEKHALARRSAALKRTEPDFSSCRSGRLETDRSGEFSQRAGGRFCSRCKAAEYARALGTVKNRFGRQYPLWIGGQAVETNSWLRSLDPSDENQVVGLAGCR